MAYVEHDKLGPIGAAVAVLHDGAALRTALMSAFASAVAAAKHAVALTDTDVAQAVHESRKALRRARAILELCAAAIPRAERRAVRRALQEARRALSPIRDHAVAPAAIGELALGDEDRDTAKRVVDASASALPTSAEIRQLLAEAATRAAAQHEALAATVPPSVDIETLLDGIARTYGDARRARKRAKRSVSWFHTWRRRSKELVYELDLVAEHAGPRVAAMRDEIQEVSDGLGAAVDLVMVRDFIATYGADIDRAALEHVQSAVVAALEDAMDQGRRDGRDAFRQKPRKLEKRLAKAIRRDLAPLDSVDGSADASASA